MPKSTIYLHTYIGGGGGGGVNSAINIFFSHLRGVNVNIPAAKNRCRSYMSSVTIKKKGPKTKRFPINFKTTSLLICICCLICCHIVACS